MKITTLIFCTVSIVVGLLLSTYALFGVNVWWLVCFGNETFYRATLSLSGVGSLWLLFWLVAFRPTKSLS